MPDQMIFPLSDSRGAAYDRASDRTSDTSDSTSDSRLSSRLSPAANEALLTIMQATAGNQTAAVHYALQLAADVCRSSWELGHVPPRQLPLLNAYMVNVPGAEPAPVRLRMGTPGGVGRV